MHSFHLLLLLIHISMKFVPNAPINNKLTSVQIMARCRSGDKPLSDPVITWLSRHKLCVTRPWWVNTLSPRQNGRHFADDIFKWMFLNENVWISIKSSLKFVPKGPINKIQHWFRWWLGAVQATNHYLKQCWLVFRRIYASLGLNELRKIFKLVIWLADSTVASQSEAISEFY